MDRRSFLLGLSAAALGLSGCGRSTAELQVSLLARALPSQLVSRFRSAMETDIKLSIAPSLQQLFTELQQQVASGKPASGAQQTNFLNQILQGLWGGPPKNQGRVSMLGDYWLSVAIAQNLIRPLPIEQGEGWKALPPQWQKLARRNRQGLPSETGEIWGAPYRWGATVLAYRKDEFRRLGWTPSDWADLWRPELQNKISLLDQPREVIGLTLKKLNRSYNTSDLTAVFDLLPTLRALDRQVKLYSSTEYLQPLLNKDIWVAVGWSTDILPEVASEPEIGFVVPRSGTALWSDLWVWPAVGSGSEGVIQKWVEFWWKPEVAQALTQFTDALSPALQDFKNSGREKELLWPTQSWFEQSEFLNPLPEGALAQYQDFWKQMRT
jgi:putative spermidine/putrescine transport system substrate-binding protein